MNYELEAYVLSDLSPVNWAQSTSKMHGQSKKRRIWRKIILINNKYSLQSYIHYKSYLHYITTYVTRAVYMNNLLQINSEVS